MIKFVNTNKTISTQFDLGRLLRGLRFHPEDSCWRRRKIRQQEEWSERGGEKEETLLLLAIRNLTIDWLIEIYSISVNKQIFHS